MNKGSNSKTAYVIASLVIFPAAIIIMVSPYFISEKMYPDTAIGTEGLREVKKYCLAFILSYIVSLLLIPVLCWLFALIYRAVSHKKLFSRKGFILTALFFMIAYITIWEPISKFDLQAKRNKYGKIPIVQAVRLYLDVNKDLKGDENTETKYDIAYLKGTVFRYAFPYRFRHNGYRPSITTVYEFGLYDKRGRLIGQISTDDNNKLSEGAFIYVPHRIETFKHSGLIKSIDGNETAEHEPVMIELTFDHDAGVLRRELICDNENIMPEMRLWTTMNGEFAGGLKVNGRTEMDFKPMIPGHAEAWIELRPDNKPAIIISNVIEYDQTKFVSPFR